MIGTDNYQPNGAPFFPWIRPEILPFFFQISLLSKNLQAEFKVPVEYPVGDVKYENGWANTGLATPHCGRVILTPFFCNGERGHYRRGQWKA